MTDQQAPGAAEGPDERPAPDDRASSETASEQPLGQPAVPPPLVPWETAPSQQWRAPDSRPVDLTVGGILSDTFARYAADPIRLFVISLIPAATGLLGGLAATPPTTLQGFGNYFGSVFLLSLISGALGLIGTSVTLALLEGGRAGRIEPAVRLGFLRVGWLLATTITVALAIFGVLLAIVIPILILAKALGGIAVIVGIIGLLVASWVSLRLTLAIPASVVDHLNTSQAIRLSWAVTRPTGVWGRIFGSLFVLGLLVGPASFLTGALTIMDVIPAPAAAVIGVLLLAFITPFTTTLEYSIYRRLVGPPPIPSSAVPQPTAAGEADPAAAAAHPNRTAAPPFGFRGRVLVAITVTLTIVGVISAPLALGAMLSRGLNFQGFAPGNVPAGTVAFGTFGSLRTCTVIGQMTETSANRPVVYMGHFSPPATPADEVRLVVTRDGAEILNEEQQRGSYSCLGLETPETDIGSGTYVFQIFVSGHSAATGTLVVH